MSTDGLLSRRIMVRLWLICSSFDFNRCFGANDGQKGSRVWLWIGRGMVSRLRLQGQGPMLLFRCVFWEICSSLKNSMV